MVCFKSGEVFILLVIDVVVCGIDVLNVSYVINFDMLCKVDIYVYCIGRIGCVGVKGMVILLVEVYDFEMVIKVVCYMGEFLKVCVIDELCFKNKMFKIGLKKKKVKVKDKIKVKVKFKKKK